MSHPSKETLNRLLICPQRETGILFMSLKRLILPDPAMSAIDDITGC